MNTEVLESFVKPKNVPQLMKK